MNIHDFKAPEFNENWLQDIFAKQTGLINKYAEIEGMPEWPMNIHTREGQRWIKDFLWRTTEELAESYEAHYLMSIEPDEEKEKAHETHRLEELIDALHFLVELILIAGKDWQWAREQLNMSTEELVANDAEDVSFYYWQVTYYLGMVGNTLKNKPWKQTEMMTDEEKFYGNLGRSLKALFLCMSAIGAEEPKVYDFYARKNQVNQFRQRSNY